MKGEAASVSDSATQSTGTPRAAAAGPCRFLLEKGGCKAGGKCKWYHDPQLVRDSAKLETPESPEKASGKKSAKSGESVKTAGQAPRKETPTGPWTKPKPAADRRKKVVLDVHLTVEEQLELRAVFPEFFIVNGAPHLTSPHAYDRAERACVSKLLPSGSRCCEVQGRFRLTDDSTRDVCRKHFTEEDGEEICADDCTHQSKMACGDYCTVVGLDVPLSAADVRALLDCPGVNQVVLALHVHSELVSSKGSQTAIWCPDTDESDNDFDSTGSVGHFRISCPGRASWTEIDHAWITLQRSVGGVKPEIIGQRGTYTLVRFTRVRFIEQEPVWVPSIWPVLKKAAAPGYFGVRMPGGELRIMRLGYKLVLVRDDRGWFGAHADHLVHAHDLTVSRTLDDHLRRKVATAIARDEGDVDALRITSTVMNVELHDQQQAQDAWDLPAPARARSRLPFAWLIPSFSRRTLASLLVLRQRGEYVRPARFWALMASLAALLVAIVPWPWRACRAITAFGWTFLELGNAGAGDPYLGFTLRVPWPTFSRLVCDWVVLWGGLDIILRALIVIAVAMCMPRLAYAHPLEVRQAYASDRFSPVYYEGPLPECFGLPGYVCDKELKPLGDGCKITVKDPSLWVDVENPKDMLFAVGVVFGGHLPHVSLPCQQNLITACRNRQLAPMPLPNETVFASVSQRYFKLFRTVSDVLEEDFQEWNSRFPAGRQRNQTAALARWQEKAITAYEVLLRNIFIKVEKVLRVEKGPFDPRVITGASDEFNVIWGCWFFKARELLKEAYADLPDNVLLASGSTSAELGAWFTRALETEGRAICGDDQLIITRGTFVESDGARHDAHMHELFFEFKWRLYEFLFRSIPRRVLWVAKEAARKSVGRSRQYGVKLEHKYRVRSGDPDTEKGNSVCTDLVAWETQNIVRSMADAGHTAAEMQEEVPKRILSLGYEVEVKISRDPTEVTFLSGSFSPVDGTMYWHPLPGRQLCKIGWSLRDTHGVVPWKDFAGVLNSYRDFSFVPFLRVYVDVVSQLIPEEYRLEPPSKRWQVGPGVTPPAPAADTWDWFTRRYSLTENDEEEFKRRLQRLSRLPYMMTDAAVEHIIHVDMA